MIKWLLNKLWEKINLASTYREIKTLGKKYGKRFFWVAILWECVEDIVFPLLCLKFKVPGLIPVFLIMHFEPIVYPVFFWGFRTWDRMQGIEPWEPDRSAQSAHWRSVLKGLTFQLSISGWLSEVLAIKTLAVFVILMSLFGFVHERIWHDTNYGILATDSVQWKRTAVKTFTYLVVSTMVLSPLLRVFGANPIWRPLILAQLITGVLYLVLERVWARSLWGVSSTTHSCGASQREQGFDGYQ